MAVEMENLEVNALSEKFKELGVNKFITDVDDTLMGTSEVYRAFSS